MFEKSFGLAENPFSMSPDPKFLISTDSHREAIAGLVYGLIERRGFIVLTGEAGTGKTTVLRSVMTALKQSIVQFSYVPNPNLTAREFIEHTILDFGVGDPPESKARGLFMLGEFLAKRHRQGKISAVIVDEAHILSPEVLEEIRLLTNFETATAKMLQIVLVGQPELDAVLNQQNLRQLKQRVSVRLRLKPLTGEQIEAYVRYRWRKAEANGPHPFTPEAIRRLAHYSGGIPRWVNSLCQGALMAAFGQDSQVVEAKHIDDVARDLELQASRSPHETATEAKVPAGLSSGIEFFRNQREPAPRVISASDTTLGPSYRAGKQITPPQVEDEPAVIDPLDRSAPAEGESAGGLSRWLQKLR